MNRRQSRRATAGYLLIATLLAAGAFIFFLDDIVRARERTYEITGIFRDGRQIQPGTVVRLAGRPVGRVTAVRLLPLDADTAARIAARLELPARFRAQVRRDSRVRVAVPQLLADPIIEIVPGSAGAPVLRHGDTLYAREPVTAERVMADAATARALVDSLLPAGLALRRRIAERRPDLERLARELDRAGREFSILGSRIEGGPAAGLIADPAWRASIDRLQTTARAIAAAARDRRTTTRDETLGPALARVAERADRLAAQVTELQAILDRPRGFPGRWDRDPALRDAIAGTRARLDSLIAETRRRPWRFFF